MAISEYDLLRRPFPTSQQIISEIPQQVLSEIQSCIPDRLERVSYGGSGGVSFIGYVGFRTYHLHYKSGCYVLRFGDDDDYEYLEAEEDGLKALLAANVRATSPICSGKTESIGFLLTQEFVSLAGSGDPYFINLGRELAKLHRSLGEFYGWHRNNFLDGSVQINSRQHNWAEFFRDNRLGYQFDLACESRFGDRLGILRDRVLDRVTTILGPHKPEPSLLHGDLWGANYYFTYSLVDGAVPVFQNPAVYFGDREADFAKIRSFGHDFPSSFYEGYQSEWPLPSGWEKRRVIYDLYHYLDLFNDTRDDDDLIDVESSCNQILMES